MPTGFKSWYIIRRVTAEWSITANIDPELAAKWNESWVYVRFNGPYHSFTPDQLEGTPFRTREAAELRAFELSLGSDQYIHNVKVVLR